MAHEDDKRLAASAAAQEVESGMLVGLGTGSTAAFLIEELGRRVQDGLRIEAVATSRASAALAAQAGIPVRDFADVAAVDLCIDGADEIDPHLRAIKGAGGAMLREKIIATAASRMLVIADGSKRVQTLGAAFLPVEILPFAQSFVCGRLEAIGAAPTLRMAGETPYRTDQQALVLDCRFAVFPEPRALADALAAIPGILGHGLFLDEVDAAYIACDGRVERIDRPSGR